MQGCVMQCLRTFLKGQNVKIRFFLKDVREAVDDWAKHKESEPTQGDHSLGDPEEDALSVPIVQRMLENKFGRGKYHFKSCNRRAVLDQPADANRMVLLCHGVLERTPGPGDRAITKCEPGEEDPAQDEKWQHVILIDESREWFWCHNLAKDEAEWFRISELKLNRAAKGREPVVSDGGYMRSIDRVYQIAVTVN